MPEPVSQVAETISELSHVTVPCLDLALAEQFYVGLLGATVLSRVDAAVRRSMGWPDTDIAASAADHVGVAFGQGGPRLDLFAYPAGVPSVDAPLHPHIGLAVPPTAFTPWHQRLLHAGVTVVGPHRLGPPGQASIYFNDPSGNHLEIHTSGVDTSGLPLGGPGRRSLRYTWR